MNIERRFQLNNFIHIKIWLIELYTHIFYNMWHTDTGINIQTICQAVLNIQVPVEHSKEVSDCKHLIKTLVMGKFLSILFIA